MDWTSWIYVLLPSIDDTIWFVVVCWQDSVKVSGIQYARASDRYTPDWFIFLLWGQFGNGASCEAILHFDMVCPLFCIGCLLCCGWFGNFWPDLIQHGIIHCSDTADSVQHGIPSQVWYAVHHSMVLCGMVWYGVLWQHVIIGPNLVIGGLRLFRVDALLLCQLFYIRPFKISFAMITMMRRVLMMNIIYNDECDSFFHAINLSKIPPTLALKWF